MNQWIDDDFEWPSPKKTNKSHLGTNMQVHHLLQVITFFSCPSTAMENYVMSFLIYTSNYLGFIIIVGVMQSICPL